MPKPSNSAQIPLFEPNPVPDYSIDAFVVSDSNNHLIETAKNWVSSQEKFLTICGGPDTGKTHLSHVIVTLFENTTIHRETNLLALNNKAKAHITHPDIPTLFILDNITPSTASPRALLDLIEDCRSNYIRLILCGRDTPSDWAQGLKDLLTRLEAMPRVSIAEPDENLMRSVIASQIKARQLALHPDTIIQITNYATPRLPRTYRAASLFTRGLDLLALSEKKPPTIKLAGHVIAMIEQGLYDKPAPKG